jgi:DNA-binding NtrC family response regulator
MLNQKQYRLVHLDDDPFELKKLSRQILQNSKKHKVVFDLTSVTNSKEFIKILHSSDKIDFCILDIVLADDEDINGMALISKVKTFHPDCIIAICSFNDQSAFICQAISEHVHDFFSKQVFPEDIVDRLLDLRNQKFCSESSSNAKNLSNSISSTSYPNCVGETLKRIEKRVQAILSSAAHCILIEGESGTGKEVVVDLFEYYMCNNKIGQKIIRLNCASLASTLLESELFGYKRGAFTGATQDKIGFIEAANHGILFLDEIATLSLDAQARLLRVIENQELIRIGETQVRKINVRFLCASNITLSELVEKKLFRKDLWQRLKEIEIYLPPLRERKSEIPELVDFFCKQFSKSKYTADPLIKKIFSELNWSDGNIRELRNALRAMTEFSDNGKLNVMAIPKKLLFKRAEETKTFSNETDERSNITLKLYTGDKKMMKTYSSLCDEILLKIVSYKKETEGKVNISQLAKELNISRSTLYEKFKNFI